MCQPPPGEITLADVYERELRAREKAHKAQEDSESTEQSKAESNNANVGELVPISVRVETEAGPSTASDVESSFFYHSSTTQRIARSSTKAIMA
jgi:hypothetical protein